MNILWAVMIAASIIYAAAAGSMSELSSAFTEEASSAASFIISTGGVICLWSGILRIAEDSGASAAVGRILSPILKRLFSVRDKQITERITENITANLMGAGNAATPAGIVAASGMAKLSNGRITRDIAVFTVLNTASVQIFPSTVIALRTAAGSAAPCSILPYVWITSAVSALIALLCVWAVWRNRR